ncbi:MAG: AMIN domain-containing protein, partial [Myxococcota bacterium]
MAAPAFAAGSAVRIERIDLRGSGDVREVVVQASKKPDFSVFRLTNPFRVLIDVNNAKMANPDDLRKVNDGLIRYISTTQFADEASKTLRVEVALDKTVPYAARTEGNATDGYRVVLTVGSDKAMPSSGAEPAASGRSKAPALARMKKVRRRMRGDVAVLRTTVDGNFDPDRVHMEQLENPARLVVDVPEMRIEPK